MKPQTESNKGVLLSPWASVDTFAEAAIAPQRKKSDRPRKQEAGPQQKQTLSRISQLSHLQGRTLAKIWILHRIPHFRSGFSLALTVAPSCSDSARCMSATALPVKVWL